MLAVTDNISLVVFVAVGIVIPFLVDLVTKQQASGALKQVVTTALAIVAGVLTEFVTAHNAGAGFDWKGAAFGAAFAFGTAIITIKGLDQTSLVGRSGVISKALPGGIGAAQPVVTATEVLNPATDTPVTPVVPPTAV